MFYTFHTFLTLFHGKRRKASRTCSTVSPEVDGRPGDLDPRLPVPVQGPQSQASKPEPNSQTPLPEARSQVPVPERRSQAPVSVPCSNAPVLAPRLKMPVPVPRS
ncbi:uncharacterized protein LOC144211944 [Stigmatopora nigra]